MSNLAFDDDLPEPSEYNDGTEPLEGANLDEDADEADEVDCEDGDGPFEEMAENAAFENAQEYPYEADFGDDCFDPFDD